MTHALKCWPKYFYRIYVGQKNFEVRKNDRHFEIGDILHIREFDPCLGRKGTLTGNFCFRKVTYIVHGGEFGIENGYCVMGLEPVVNTNQ